MSSDQFDHFIARVSTWCHLNNVRVFIPKRGPVRIERKMYDEGVAVIYLILEQGKVQSWDPSREGWETVASTQQGRTSYVVYAKARRILSKRDQQAVDQHGRPPKDWVWPEELLSLA